MFRLNDDETKRFYRWLNEHDKTCRYSSPLNSGAIGGRLTYSFTPNGLGEIIRIKCACGKEVCVTNYEEW